MIAGIERANTMDKRKGAEQWQTSATSKTAKGKRQG